MKLVVSALLCVAAATLAVASDDPRLKDLPVPARDLGRGCIYVEGHCQSACEVGTHAYAPGCSPVLSERTCTEPVARTGRGVTCDYTRCDCDEPTVKDESTGKCVQLSECPKV